ncbi:MAG: hypothetical protein AAF899_07730 [Pseudomonadota bacterium]
MTAAVVQINEAVPVDRFTPPGGPSGVSADAVWLRIEAFTVARWGERTVTLWAEGPGDLTWPLVPFSLSTAEVWVEDDGWQATTLNASPFGAVTLPGCSVYRITGTAGATSDPPADVQEAWLRLARYMAEVTADTGHGKSAESDGDYRYSRRAQWAAQAMHLSGAGDLLRAYRVA